MIVGELSDPTMAQEMSDLNHAAFGYRQLRDLSGHRVRQRMKDIHYKVYGAMKGRHPLGFVYVNHFPDGFIEDSRELSIEDFSILPWAHGKGIGSIILDYVVNTMYPDASFNLCVSANNKAVFLYKKFGFISYGINHLVRCDSYIAMGLIRHRRYLYG